MWNELYLFKLIWSIIRNIVIKYCSFTYRDFFSSQILLVVLRQLRKAEVRRENFVRENVRLITRWIPQLRLLQLLQVILLPRGHFRCVLYRLKIVLRWLRQVAGPHSESILIVCRVSHRLQNSICIHVGISYIYMEKKFSKISKIKISSLDKYF